MSLAVMAVRPSLAAAQLPGADAPSLYLPVAVGQMVSVTTADGRKLGGRK